MSMFLKAFLPVAFGAPHVAYVAVSALEFVNNTREEGYRKFVLEGKIGGKSIRSFENHVQFAIRKAVLEDSSEYEYEIDIFL